MIVVWIAGIWLAVGAVVSVVAGGGISRGQQRRARSAEPQRTIRSTHDYLVLPTDEWALASHRVATEALLSTRPGMIRRVGAPQTEPEN